MGSPSRRNMRACGRGAAACGDAHDELAEASALERPLEGAQLVQQHAQAPRRPRDDPGAPRAHVSMFLGCARGVRNHDRWAVKRGRQWRHHLDDPFLHCPLHNPSGGEKIGDPEPDGTRCFRIPNINLCWHDPFPESHQGAATSAWTKTPPRSHAGEKWSSLQSLMWEIQNIEFPVALGRPQGGPLSARRYFGHLFLSCRSAETSALAR